MKMSKKNLIYSMILAGVLMCLVIGYFIFMLPSLYVEHMKSRNLNSIIEQHRAYLRDGNYSQVSVNNPVACISFEMPFDENVIYLTLKLARIKVEPKQADMLKVMSEVKAMIREASENEQEFDMDTIVEKFKKNAQTWKEMLEEYGDIRDLFPFSATILESQDFESMFSGERMKYHMISEDLYVFENSVTDSNNQYMNYIAYSMTDESVVVSYLPVMAPQMNEITPVIMQSIPMITAVLILFVLIFSRVYSTGIVTPIVTLAARTRRLQPETSHVVSVNAMEESREGMRSKLLSTDKRACEEIRLLSETINCLYVELQESCRLLEEKNQSLAEENKRQEVFLRASSHQLKTPIAAALLLVDGMKNRIGKYEDTDKYLPEVKKQLLYMKKTVEDVLYLNHIEEMQEYMDVDISALVSRQMMNYEVMIREKNLAVLQTMEAPLVVQTDEVIAGKIIDNLISNAVKYTPQNGEIAIRTIGTELCIYNSGISIPQELLEHIYEPFVSGSKEGSCRGLGLYIAAYYAKHLGVKLTIQNTDMGVTAKLHFSNESKERKRDVITN